MPTLEENKKVFEHTYDWPKWGDEWSYAWGNAEMQWYGVILPRVHAFLPASTILEIAPGFGRWTQFLKENCSQLYLVDISEKCISACKARFGNCPHISYYVNDGKSLDFIPDRSIDLAFSFDSLVHAENDVIQAYLDQLGKKLTRDGIGFLHHSNVGEYKLYLSLLRKLPSPVVRILTGLGVAERLESQWRAHSVSASLFSKYAEDAGLACISQETINWFSKRLIDCISIVTPKESIWDRPKVLFRNKYFMREAAYISRLSQIYCLRFKPAPADISLEQISNTDNLDQTGI